MIMSSPRSSCFTPQNEHHAVPFVGHSEQPAKEGKKINIDVLGNKTHVKLGYFKHVFQGDKTFTIYWSVWGLELRLHMNMYVVGCVVNA